MLAQLPSGTVAGKVASVEGEALPGVTVTVSSSALQGTRSATTSETGEYNIPFLPPGEYEVSFELEGFSNPKQSVKISAAQNTRLDAELTTASVAEEIVVTGTYDTISTSQQAATTYEKKLIESLPMERNIRETVLLTPGVAATGPNSAGTAGARARGISIAGSQSYENLFLVNGVVITENLRGQPYDLFIEDAIEETTTTVSGVSAEYGRFSGGVVNTITKSGGNELHGTIRTALTNQSWEEKTPVTTAEQADKTNKRYEATLGGWLWKDRVWYFAAGRDFADKSTSETTETTFPYEAGSDQQRYEGKLTVSPFQGHRLVGSYIKIDEDEAGNKFGTVLDLASISTRSLPQELMAINYTGVITENFFVEGQYSERTFTFENAGSKFTDRIFGTLMVDNPTGRRWWSPTFCGVCLPEERNNENILAKGSWFLSSENLGSHDLSFGYDSFDDERVADNHQSGSDFRIITLSHITRNGQVFPVLQSDPAGTLGQYIQWNPILKGTEGTSFVTNSYFLNDKWRLNDRWSFNVGLRFDENDGQDAGGQTVAKDSRISPRVSAGWDMKGDGSWIFNASYGEYVAAIANTQANSTTAAGNPATIRWHYRGPSINTDSSQPLIGTEEALRQIFAWFDAQGGTNNTGNLRLVSIPGGTSVIRSSLDSPYAQEYSIGVSKRLGSRGVARADYVHRDYEDFYASRTDLSTGRVTTATGSPADLSVLENNNEGIERVYDGLHTQLQYRFSDRFNLGSVFTVSHLRGTFDGETSASGPVQATLHDYPEYKDPRWNAPRGDLSIDQRHRARVWAVYDLLRTDHHNLNVSLLQNYASGVPYGAQGAVATRNLVTNPGYVLPPANVTYWFTNRDGFRTSAINATDLSFNYSFQWQLLNKSMEVYIQPEVINLFNNDSAYFVNQTIYDATTGCPSPATNPNCRVNPGLPFNSVTNPAKTFKPFNPFTETPVEGVNWQKGPQFGQGVIPSDYQEPRTYRVSVGFRF
jgi:outer membrane receptor for ferrienterochelin and colicin